jgi:Na+/melibiose symporter-like transporter
LLGLRLTISIYPAILYCVIVGALCFYSIGKKRNLQIQDDLAERRRQVESEAGV